jgi:hypothetical protein
LVLVEAFDGQVRGNGRTEISLGVERACTLSLSGYQLLALSRITNDVLEHGFLSRYRVTSYGIESATGRPQNTPSLRSVVHVCVTMSRGW